MREAYIEIPENLWQITDEEIAVIQACIYFVASGDTSTMNPKASKILDRLSEKLNMHRAIGTLQVWN